MSTATPTNHIVVNHGISNGVLGSEADAAAWQNCAGYSLSVSRNEEPAAFFAGTGERTCFLPEN